MEKEHHFYASYDIFFWFYARSPFHIAIGGEANLCGLRVKAYKTHIARWGLRKNLGRHVVGALLRQQRCQASDADGPQYASVQGQQQQPVPHRVRKYLSRVSETTFEEVISIASKGGAVSQRDADAATRARLAVASRIAPLRTPPRQIPGRLEGPDEVKVLEHSVHIIRNYLAGVRDSQTWRVDARGVMWSAAGEPFTYAGTSWIRQVCLARTMIAGGRTDRGFQMLNICFDQYKTLLHQHNPTMLLDTYRAAFVLASVDLRLARSFLGYVSGLTKCGRLAAHPLGPLLARFHEMQIRGMALQSRNVSECLIETLVRLFPSVTRLHHILLGTEDDVWGLGYEGVGCDLGVPSGGIVKGIVRGLAKALSAQPPPSLPKPRDAVYLRNFRSSVLYNNGELEPARKIAEDSLASYDEGFVDHGKEICYYLLYSIYTKSGDHERALEMARERVKICLALYGSGQILTTGAYGRLEECLRRLGRHEDAEEVRREGDAQWDDLCANLTKEHRL